MKIGIAGAGLLGRLLGWQLLRAGHEVSLFDRDDDSGEQSAGYIAAAMLAPFSEAVTAGPEVLSPGLTALKCWPRWLHSLGEEGGEEVPFGSSGSIVVAHPNDRADLQWFYRRLRAMPGVAETRNLWLEGGDVQALEPGLQEFAEGVYLPLEGWLDNRALYRALRHAISRAGGVWHCGREISAVGPRCLSSGAQEHRFDLAIDCRGFGAREQLQNFRGVRGEVIRVRAPEVNFTRPVRLMHPRYQLYVAPRPDSVYVIGATEIESESLAPVTVRSCLELLSALYTLHSGFAEAEVLEARAHCRPAFGDNLPRIIQQEGLLQVNGLYRHGFLLAPALVESVLSLLSGGNISAPVQFEQVRAEEADGRFRELSA